MEFDIPASQKDRQLPMIVNLRGDEELVDIFNWDADQTMEFLAIKRSRLTQISGKELRVGRIRRDRYLRPVYREADVRDYQEWTRATATHQSSSRAIEQAIDSLDDRFSDLFVVLQEKLQQFEARSSRLLLKQLQKIAGVLHQNFQILGEVEPRLLQDITERVAAGQRLLHSAQNGLQEHLQSSHQELELLRGLFVNFHQDLRGLLAAQNSWRRELLDAQHALAVSLEARDSSLLIQNQKLQGQLEELQQSLRLLQEGQSQLLAAKEKATETQTLRQVQPRLLRLQYYRPRVILRLQTL